MAHIPGFNLRISPRSDDTASQVFVNEIFDNLSWNQSFPMNLQTYS